MSMSEALSQVLGIEGAVNPNRNKHQSPPLRSSQACAMELGKQAAKTQDKTE